ncbi:hypothetical protein KIW84_051440 [Lathyrus oleraceus]|uniref:Uncharacterized protein n=1 Tax=Pisum sativum TaxID=3888 RepID=A0A9D5ADP3_PEA|nr:hypothetical protein KIW84_051440 [Pisum sativum]
MKMHDYLSKMKNLADKLKLARNLILNSYLIIQTLNGLDSEYNPIVVKLSNQINLSWIDLQSKLLSFESRTEQLISFNSLSLNVLANVANKTDYKGNWRNNRLGFHGSNVNWRGSNSRGNLIIDVIPEGDISDEVNPIDSQIEQQSQDDNNSTEVDNNIIEQFEDTILDDATHPERQPDITHQSTFEASNAGIIQTISKSGIHKPKLSYIGLADTYKDTMGPTNAKDALTRPLWKEAMQKEFQALMFTWIYHLKQKFETVQAFIQFKVLAKNQYNKRIKVIQCDRGGEYKPMQRLAIEADIGNPITDVIPKGYISDEVNPVDSQIEQQSQDDNNATEVDNNIIEQSEDTILDDATHPERL